MKNLSRSDKLLFKRKLKLENIHPKLDIREPSIKQTVEMLELTAQDLKYLKNIQDLVEQHSNDIVDNFYKAVSMDESMTKIINSNSSIDRLKSTIKPHILEFFSGIVDSNYIKKRETIANVHLRIGLSSKNYILAFTSILKDITKLIHKNIKSNEDKINTTQALIKIVSLEKFLVLSAFDEAVEKQQRDIQQEKDGLSEVIIDNANRLAATSEQSLASYEEITAQMHNVLDFAMKGKQIAESMKNKANEGKTSIQRQTTSLNKIITNVSHIEDEMQGMKSINKQIEEIVSTINEISSQTKLIALNAQIEASRLGDKGNGFNVIAQEVRSLSNTTSESIKLANNLLSDIHSETDELQNAVRDVSHSVQGAVANLQNTESRFSEIMNLTNDNQEQSSMIKTEISSLEDVMIDLASAIEEIAGSAEELSSLSNDLF